MKKKPRGKKKKLTLVEAKRRDLETASQTDKGEFRRFSFGELSMAMGQQRGDLDDDLVFEAEEQDRKAPQQPRRAPEEAICPCVLILVIAKTPSQDGERSKSHYARGASRKRRLEFYRKIQSALDLLRDAGAFDNACITTYFDLDLSARRYHRYFPTNHAGQRMGYLDATRLHDLSALICRDLGSLGTDRCLTVVLGVGLAIPGAIGGPSGRTPTNATPVPGSNPPVWDMDTLNISYLIDTAPAYKIAHEIAHQSGLTHASDNHIHPDGDGLPSGSVVPPALQRPSSDLLARRPDEDATLQPQDAARMRAYLRTSKCCDLTESDGSSVR